MIIAMHILRDSKITSFDPLDESVWCPSSMPIILKNAEAKKRSIPYTRLTVISKRLPQCSRNALGLCLLGLASTDAGGEGDNS